MKHTKLLIIACLALVLPAQAQLSTHKSYEEQHYQGMRYGWYKPAATSPGNVTR